MPRLRAMLLLSLATSLFVPAFAQNPGASNTNTARPGTINYVEGQVSLNGQTLTSQSVGSAELAPGQTVTTQNGKAEVLLTPGVFLRLGDNSAVTMVSPDLTKTEVQVDRGRAEVEVDLLYKQNNLLIDQGPAQTKLLKNGLYAFDATANTMRVFDGEAAVSPSQNAARWITVKNHHQLALNGDRAKPQDFNAEVAANNDPLYNWSKLRADYLGQANLNLAESYAGDPGFYPGWFWDSALYGYTWLPYDGLFWSPFGYGFYSPWYLYGGGFIYPGYGFRGGFYHGPYRAPVGAVHAAPAPAVHGFAGGGFHGGGFGGGGGFHGGGGGGRR
jgi:FecR protein